MNDNEKVEFLVSDKVESDKKFAVMKKRLLAATSDSKTHRKSVVYGDITCNVVFDLYKQEVGVEKALSTAWASMRSQFLFTDKDRVDLRRTRKVAHFFGGQVAIKKLDRAFCSSKTA
ncbi:MAG: hypothetical protein SGILL_003695 [Bacillariaceae sp.]